MNIKMSGRNFTVFNNSHNKTALRLKSCVGLQQTYCKISIQSLLMTIVCTSVLNSSITVWLFLLSLFHLKDFRDPEEVKVS